MRSHKARRKCHRYRASEATIYLYQFISQDGGSSPSSIFLSTKSFKLNLELLVPAKLLVIDIDIVLINFNYIIMISILPNFII